jgi:hypothetical protein
MDFDRIVPELWLYHAFPTAVQAAAHHEGLLDLVALRQSKTGQHEVNKRLRGTVPPVLHETAKIKSVVEEQLDDYSVVILHSNG